MIVYQGKFLRVVDEKGWEYVERVHSQEAVVIIAVNNLNQVILVEQYRLPLHQWVIELPAGLLKDPESPANETREEAAKRELEEETGYTAEEVELLTSGPPSSGLSHEIAVFYQASSLRKVSAGGGVGSEQIRVHEIDLKKVEGWLQGMEAQGKWIDPKIYVGLFFLKTRSNKTR